MVKGKIAVCPEFQEAENFRKRPALRLDGRGAGGVQRHYDQNLNNGNLNTIYEMRSGDFLPTRGKSQIFREEGKEKEKDKENGGEF